MKEEELKKLDENWSIREHELVENLEKLTDELKMNDERI